MSHHRGRIISGMAVLSILAGVLGAAFHLTGVSGQRESLMTAPPKIQAPDYLDSEEVELGKVAEITFQIANGGGRPLFLNNFRKNCACDNLGVKEGDEYVVLESLWLGPGETADVKLSQSVRGVIGKEAVSSLSFATNDPTRPEVFISIRTPNVTAGVSCIPKGIDFGILKEGQKKELSFDVFDLTGEKRSVEKVVCDIPHLIKSTFLPFSQCSNLPKPNPAHPFLGRVFLELVAKRSEHVQGSVSVYLQSRPLLPDSVQITGRIASMIEVAPSSFILPRQSGSGPIYEATCSIRSHFSDFSIRVTKCSEDLLVSFDQTRKDSSHMLKIAFTGSKKIDQLTINTERKISFMGIFGGAEIPFEIPILILKEDLR